MAARRVIATAKAPRAIGPYSQGILTNGTLYISGQLGLNAETMEFVGPDIEAQTKSALQNVGHILEAAGMNFSNVVKMTMLLDDMNEFKKANDIYSTFFGEIYPARAAYQVARLPKDAKVEIEAVAVETT